MLVKHEWIEGLGRFPVSFAVPGNGPGAHQGGLCGTSTPALFNLCHRVAISPPRRKIVHRFLACFPAAFLKEPDYERVQSASGFDGSIACVFEVVRTFFGSEAIEDCADSAPEGFAGSGRRVAHPVSGLGEGLFDGVQIRTLWRQEQKVSPGRADRLSGRLAFVAAEVVDHDHIARSQDRHQNAFDTGAEDVAVHRAIEHPRRIDPIVAQGGDEGGRVPVPEGRDPPAGAHLLAPILAAEPCWS